MGIAAKGLRVVIPAVIAGLALNGCWFYSFTGASIPSHLSTIAIPLAVDNSTNTLTALDEQLTTRLVRRFVEQTRLSLQRDEQVADATLSARIDRYTNLPASVTGEERAALNRVTISVSIDYFDRVRDEPIIQRTFSNFEEYDPADPERGLDGELDAALAVLDKIADDVFTEATSNW